MWPDQQCLGGWYEGFVSLLGRFSLMMGAREGADVCVCILVRLDFFDEIFVPKDMLPEGSYL